MVGSPFCLRKLFPGVMSWLPFLAVCNVFSTSSTMALPESQTPNQKYPDRNLSVAVHVPVWLDAQLGTWFSNQVLKMYPQLLLETSSDKEAGSVRKRKAMRWKNNPFYKAMLTSASNVPLINHSSHGNVNQPIILYPAFDMLPFSHKWSMQIS